MVLGFARLLQIDIDEAKNSFGKAIDLDPSAPLPRLGMGLAKIRQGEVEEGTKDIEVAAVLDPANSLIRSYLGKAYYEEKRGHVASREFERAKKLDPNDPTPWFYDAIHKQTTNRPVEALHDMQKAIKLNDNRAVYRSSLLLDDDLAARSASLGRIYNDLGFQQRGLVEGWRSVNTDPGNYSAHRLLADNYAALPRHEIARVSELLQSQLFQPINTTPVQPNLAESNLFLLEDSGPSASSYNEFNPLFVQNRLALQASGVFGTNDTLGDEVTQSGIWNKFSYSLGQLHFETDGFRENNDLDVNIYDAYLQGNISPELNIQAEYRHRDLEAGNLESFFSPTEDNLNRQQNFRTESESDMYRFGLHVSPWEHSDLLASFIYAENDEMRTLPPGRGTFTPSDGYFAETQYLYRQDVVDIILGGGYYRLNLTDQTGDFVTQSKTEHGNAYLYSLTRFPSPVTWTLGLSGDIFDAEQSSSLNGDVSTSANIKRRLNPKIGLLWNIVGRTVFRAAWLESFKRSPFFNQSLEPTQVAGFNQFFDDPTGTRSERWGVGLDFGVGSNFTGGAEISERYLTFPLQRGNADNRWQEVNYRAYLQYTPHPRWAAKIEYSRENFDNCGSGGGPLDTETQTLPVRVSYFDPSGLFIKLQATYFK